jgi:hypothetical protein
MSRSDIPDIKDRRPFYLYVDEFQNFATDSFATILSEARKYGLNLTVANQYISQMSDTVRDAVFGNVGTMISFRVSADDAPILAKQFEPQFEPNDLLQMHNRHFIINMVIGGEKAPAFSATTLTLPPAQVDNTGRIIERTRLLYSRSRAEVENEISEAINPQQQQPKPPQSPALAKQWPINAQTRTITPAQRQKPVEQGKAVTKTPALAPTEAPAPSTVAEIDPTTPPKRKRTRKRKRKTPTDGSALPAPVPQSAPTPATPAKQPAGDSSELNLR